MSEESVQEIGKNFSSNTSKYLAKVNRPRLLDFRKGRGFPKMLHISPTDKCNIRCFYCSSDKRDGDTMSLDYILNSVDRMLEYSKEQNVRGLESVEITGGGDPQEYPQINELISGLYDRGLAIGMISNGEYFQRRPSGELNILPETSAKLTWLRCSLNWKPRKGKDMEEWPFVIPDIPLPDTPGRPKTQGFSLVMSAGYVEQGKLQSYIETPRSHFDRAVETAVAFGADYLRVVTNCLGRSEDIDRAIEKFRHWVVEFNQKHGSEFAYWQHKYPTSPDSPCYTGYFRPFVNSDGWVYPCSSCTLSEEQFPKSLRIARFHELPAWFDESRKIFERTGKVRPVVSDPGNSSGCVNCTFKDNVQLLDRVMGDGFDHDEPGPEEVQHEQFI